MMLTRIWVFTSGCNSKSTSYSPIWRIEPVDNRISCFCNSIPAADTVRVRLVYAHALRDDCGMETLEIPLPEGAGAIGAIGVDASVAATPKVAALDCPQQRAAPLLRTSQASSVRHTEACWTLTYSAKRARP